MKIADEFNPVERPVWQDREGRTPVPMNQWGQDHWSLFVYIETCCVDERGRIDWRHLTLSKRNWPMLYAARDHGAMLGRYTGYFGEPDNADRYGLRLRGKDADGEPVKLMGHCEADALMDLVTNDLVVITMPHSDAGGEHFLKPNGRKLLDGPDPRCVTGRAEWELMPWAKFALTDRGREIANTFRAYKAAGKATWSGFADLLEAEGRLS